MHREKLFREGRARAAERGGRVSRTNAVPAIPHLERIAPVRAGLARRAEATRGKRKAPPEGRGLKAGMNSA
jgi:hypothetical protein